MIKMFVVFTCAVLVTICSSSPVEDSVVSVYTTQSTTAGTNPPLDVYKQIANNLADRFTSPIYRFLGYNKTMTPPSTTTKRTRPQIELLDEQDLTTSHDFKLVENDIDNKRDVEELSPGVTKSQKKPEKITLYSSLASAYLPVKLQVNNTGRNEVDDALPDSLELDDVEMDRGETTKPRDGPFIYVLEIIGSLFQLLWGGLTSLFKPNNGTR